FLQAVQLFGSGRAFRGRSQLSLTSITQCRGFRLQRGPIGGTEDLQSSSEKAKQQCYPGSQCSAWSGQIACFRKHGRDCGCCRFGSRSWFCKLVDHLSYRHHVSADWLPSQRTLLAEYFLFWSWDTTRFGLSTHHTSVAFQRKLLLPHGRI